MDVDYYDSIAEGYSELHGMEQLRKAQVIATELRPKESELLLDVGCGPASYFPLFRCRYVGIDPSIGLLEQGRLEIEENGAEEVTLLQAKAESLPFSDKSFDYVISITAVHNFDSIPKGLSEIHRVAKKTIALSILRASAKFSEIESGISELFKIKRLILEEKDVIFILEKK
jgi:ubiquinone/menaquinone biosynthesis C-methylase UbiE